MFALFRPSHKTGVRHRDKLREYYVGRGRVSGVLPSDRSL
jgi:hypothetical protein